MINFFSNLLTSFALGLLTPLTALCVLPLYPGFLAYLSKKLSKKEKDDRRLLVLFGLVIVFGVILFMFLLGLIFTTFLQASLTQVIGIVSPIAFGILLVISVLLIFNVDVGKFLPKFHAPILKNPLLSAFIYGFFFGAIVIPCNPLFIAALFTRTAVSSNFAANLLSFLFFGLGIGFPLLVFSFISSAVSKAIVGFLTKYQRTINLLSGIIMLVISLYYLLFVFKIFG
jgi:cytochrome c-type biogenesis protein